MRWLGAVVAVLVVIAAGYVVFLNPHPVDVYVRPGDARSLPLAGALLTSFAAGAIVVGGVVAVRGGARRFRSWRTSRHERRRARRAATVARAQQLVWAGDYRQARSELLRGEPATPTDRDRIALLAETHLQEGDVATARKLLDDGLHQVGLDARLLALLADAAERGADLRAAADALERARQAEPGSPRLARRLRDVYAASGRWREAMALQADILVGARDAASLATEERIMRGLRYQAALAEDDPRQAARALVALAREDRGFMPAWVSAGDVLARSGRRLAARRVWERGARYDPAVVLLDRLERLNASEGKSDRTVRLYRRLRRRHPENRALPIMLVRHLIAQGRIDEAAAEIEALGADAAGHRLVHALAAEVHRRRGNHNLAADEYAQALGTDLGAIAPYRCARCRRAAETWEGHCAECGEWGTYRAAVEAEG
jgi:lipopolysaccharide biosynthesis regulator YciM